MLLLVNKSTEIIGIVFAILVIVLAFGVAIMQILKIKKQKRLEEEHKKQLKLAKQERRNKKGK